MTKLTERYTLLGVGLVEQMDYTWTTSKKPELSSSLNAPRFTRASDLGVTLTV